MPSRIKTSLPAVELEVATGNYDTSRKPIDRVIIHTMAGTWQGAAARFDNPTSQVSAHYGIKVNGEYIHWLEETFTAYANGNYPMNQRAVSIEHEDLGKYNDPRPDALYTASAKLVRDICMFYNIPIDRQHILKHSEVSDKPTACPDALDIDRIVREANGSATPTTTPPTNPTSASDQAIIDDLRTARDNNYNMYQAEIAKNASLSTQISDLQATIKKLEGKVSDLERSNTDLQAEVQAITLKSGDLAKQLSEVHTEDSATIEAGINAQTELKNLNIELFSIATALNCDNNTNSITNAIELLQAKVRTNAKEKDNQAKASKSLFDLFIKLFVKKKG